MKLEFFQNEIWYGGAASEGIRQPYTADSNIEIDLTTNHTANQTMPLLVSSAGRWLWNENGMFVTFCNGTIRCTDSTVLRCTDGGLRQAYLDAMQTCFPWHEITLDSRLFSGVIYNTWIELTFDQRQEKILLYAKEILEHGMPAGVLMIDDGWSDYYGRWCFSLEKFSDPSSMLAQLHQMGFAVMMWVCPFITPDTIEYRELERRGLLIRSAEGEIHIAHWWNGWSAVLDMTNPEAAQWLKTQMDSLQALGVDGFKFDGGDSIYYPQDGDKHSRAWAAFGEQYPLNEYRVTNRAGGWSLMQRQCDKQHSWGETGLKALIPDAIVQSLTGHPYLCPDMIGGGEYQNFYSHEHLDEELFVRWAQIACMMPVMQFSAAPWRVLSQENFQAILKAVELRKQCQKILQDALAISSRSGEPILRPMAYDFTYTHCAHVTDQFMIGPSLLVAPLLEKGAAGRNVFIPKGRWLLLEGEQEIQGECTCFIPAINGPILLIAMQS